MTCETARRLIDSLVDDALDPVAHGDLDAHLRVCPACRALAEDLLVVARAARSLPLLAPPESSWHRLAAAISAPPAVGAPLRPSRQWVGAALAIAAVLIAAVGITVVVRRGRAQDEAATRAPAVAGPTSASSGPDVASADLSSLEAELQQAEANYENAIVKLEVLARDRRALNLKDAAVLQKNLRLIDTAIGESRAALKAQPSSERAQESLFEAFRSKIALLQDTIALVNEMRKGNQAEAARIADGLNKS
jgi:hypothetical protein